MDERILKIMREILEDDTIDASCNKQNCEKWDSLHQLNLVAELEEEFNIEFEPEEIVEMKSFDKIKVLIDKKMR
jgi:acyl carrier protein